MENFTTSNEFGIFFFFFFVFTRTASLWMVGPEAYEQFRDRVIFLCSPESVQQGVSIIIYRIG